MGVRMFSVRSERMSNSTLKSVSINPPDYLQEGSYSKPVDLGSCQEPVVG